MAKLLSFMKSAVVLALFFFAQMVVAAEFRLHQILPLHKRLHQHTFIRT